MIKVFIFGLSGKMGKMLCECADNKEFTVVGGFDVVPHPTLPTFCDINAVNINFDVIVDFSRPETIKDVVCLAAKTLRPAVLATTGYDESQQSLIDGLSKKVAVFQSGNMSFGISVLGKLTELAAKLLSGSADIEIIEKHHNQKVDAPSGTAKMLEKSVEKGIAANANFVYGRHGNDCLRHKGDVGVHAIRGGTIVGEHEIMFCCNDEIITISHSARSRKIFAEGALKAAKFLQNKKPGKYCMDDATK